MLNDVTVVVWGEFGRTPRINEGGGRDHWPQCYTVLLAGGGVLFLAFPKVLAAGLSGFYLAIFLLLWALILCTAIAFRRVRPLAAALLVPYLGWVSFAAALTWAIWKRNPGLLG